jgi:hypothetical protein
MKGVGKRYQARGLELQAWIIVSEDLQAQLIIWEELQAKLYLRFVERLEVTVAIPP